MENCHAYICIPPSKAGKREVRKIIATSSIKKFSFDEYEKNPNCYKDKAMKFIDEQGEKVQCFILHIGDTYDEVDTFVKTHTKRFHVPNFNVSYDGTNGDTSIEENSHVVSNAKKNRKKSKQLKQRSSKDSEADIASQYLNNEENNEYNDETLLNDQIRHTSPIPMSSPRATIETERIDAPAALDRLHGANAYMIQAEYFKRRYFEVQTEKDKLLQLTPPKLAKHNAENNTAYQDHNSADNAALLQYDHVFNLPRNKEVDSSNTGENSTEENCTYINKGVKCNALAYKDAFKTKNPRQFFTIMNRGIYGVEDLANRCVRKQRNTENRNALSPIKKEVVEDEFYRFLKLKNYSYNLIADELEKCNDYHHGSIIAARKALQRQNRSE